MNIPADTNPPALEGRNNTPVPTPRINAAVYNGYDHLVKEARKMERDNVALIEALDTLSLVVGLTPIAGNKEALQEAMDLARATLAKAREES